MFQHAVLSVLPQQANSEMLTSAHYTKMYCLYFLLEQATGSVCVFPDQNVSACCISRISATRLIQKC